MRWDVPLPHLRALAVYALLTVLATWPMAFRLTVMDAGDSAFFAWEVGWELHALATGPAQLPHGNFFHPLRHTLGMDEPILGTTLLVAPLRLFTDDAVWLLNLARLLTFVFTGYTTWLFARSLGLSEVPALFAGAAFTLSPIRTDQIAHVSTLGTQYLPLVLLFTFRFFREERLRDALLAGLSYVLATLACGYQGLIGLAALPCGVLVLLWGRWRLLPRALAGVAVAAAGLLPLYAMHKAALDPFRYARSADETVRYSASLETFFATSAWNLLYGELTAPLRTTEANKLFPGLVVPALGLLGLALVLRRGQRPGREALALFAIALAAVAVAIGPEVRLFGQTLGPGPFALVRELPIFRTIRVTARAGALIALPLAVLSAKGLQAWGARPRVRAAVIAAALLETVIAPIPMPGWAQVIDSRQPPPPVYAWLAQQPGPGAVVELPILDIEGILERSAFHESVYMVHSTRGHWRPLLNGYTGIEPAPYVELRNACQRFPSAPCLDVIRARGARWVVLHKAGYGVNKRARLERDLPSFQPPLVEVARFGDDVVYEFAAGPGGRAGASP